MNRSSIAGSLILASVFGVALTLHAQPPPRAQVRVDLSRMKARAIEVEQPGGRGRVVDATASQVMVKPWQYVAARTGTDAVAIAPPSGQAQAWSLPVVITTATEAGAQLDLEIVLTVTNGLMMRGSDGVYSGDVFIGVTNKQNPTATDPLGAPVHVLLSGQVDTIDPAATVEIKHTNLPYERVSLRARPTADEVILKARASFASQDADVPIRVTRPSLRLRVQPAKIQGFGLETAEIIVSAEGHPSPNGRAVAVGSTAGRVEPTGLVTLNVQGVATAQLRADGLGSTTVDASGDGFRDAAPLQVAFGFPFLFLGAAFVGGLMGGFLRSRSGRRTPASRQTAILIGMLQGLGVAVLYAIGINALGWAPKATAGGALVFASALLGAWVDLGAILKKNSK